MCGIVGVFLRDGACEPAVLARMRDLVAHRGPDDSGSFIDGSLALGHRRLSIIDLGTGHQPMATPDGRYTIVFNGEIYNYRELRRELESKGIAFRTQSDTEVILQLHALHGDLAAARLNGIFTYALWDSRRRRLLLTRDRAGIKPLYYSNAGAGVAFGSEIKSLFESGLVRPRLAERHLAEYLVFRHVAGPDCLFEDIAILPPGHTVAISEGRASEAQPFWNARDPVARFGGSYAEAVDALDRILAQVVERQMIADVPVGTFCSGGIDSSLTTVLAASQSNGVLDTYSVAFEDPALDESRFARMASDLCRSRHEEIRVDEARFAELLPRLIWHHDQPLNFANSVHIFAVSELARRRVKVVLTGEGADELFGGYPRYAIPRLVAMLDRLPNLLRRALVGVMGRAPDHRFRKLAEFARRNPADRLMYNSTDVNPEFVGHALHRAGSTAASEFRRSLLESAAGPAELDFETYLQSILNRQDKMSMAASLEARVPFLDNELIEFARSLPPEFKQTTKDRKRVLKDVARRYLPGAIVDRPKSGFGVPVAGWLRGDGPVSALLARAISMPAVTDVLKREALSESLAAHRSGARDHSEFLWGVLNLGLWREAYDC